MTLSILNGRALVIFLFLLCSWSAHVERQDDIKKIITCLLPTESDVGEKQLNAYATYKTSLIHELEQKEDGHLEQMAPLCRLLFPQNLAFSVNTRGFELHSRELMLNEHFELINQMLESDKSEYYNDLKDITALLSSIKEHQSALKEILLKHKSSPEKIELKNIIDGFVPTYTKEYIVDNLSINLMWVYKTLSTSDNYIFPHPYVRQNVSIDLFARINNWAQMYPQVNIWYDSKYVSPAAVAQTQEKIARDFPDIAAKVKLIDVRTLELVQKYSHVFDHESIYFRADLLRIVLSYEMLQSSPKGSFLAYADMGAEPLTPHELLDPLTIFNINTYGFVLPQRNRTTHFENSFHFMGNHKMELLKALKSAVIDINIKRVGNSDFINGRYAPTKGGAEKFHQLVYDSYPVMFHVLYGLMGKSEEMVCGTRFSDKNLEQLDSCLWEFAGVTVSFPIYIPIKIVDPVLKLQTKLKNGDIYLPVIINNKFTVSHFG